MWMLSLMLLLVWMVVAGAVGKWGVHSTSSPASMEKLVVLLLTMIIGIAVFCWFVYETVQMEINCGYGFIC